MINLIVDAISVAINNEFGDDYDIYTEKIEQGLNEPCFLVTAINQTHKQFFSKRYKKEHLLMIQYFPSSQEIKSECNDVAERLNNCLEYIKIGNDSIRGTNMNSQIVDDVLNFSVNYDVFVIKNNEDIDYMNDIESNVDLKGD